jgi:uncharacterized protein (DUF983 family)
MMEFDLEMDGKPVKVSVEGGSVTVGKEKVTPKAVSWDSRRRFPFLVVMFIGIIVVIAGAVAGAVLVSQDLVWAALIIVLPLTVIALLVMSRLMGGSEDLIVVRGKGGEYVLTGAPRMLRDLHYETSKLTIAMMKKEEKERNDGRAGSYLGSDVLSKEDRSALQRDMKRFVGKKKTVTTTICPQCGSTELYYEAGLITGYVYHCKKCDYVGSFVMEKELQV